MVQPLRRAKVGDLAGTAIILAIFCAIPLAMLVLGRRRIADDVLRVIFTVLLGLSGPLALLAAFPLAFFWWKDRSIDRYYLSTATISQLGIIVAANFLVVVSAVLLVSAEIVNFADNIRTGHRVDAVLSAFVLILLTWIVYLVIRMLLLVRKTQKEMLAAQAPPQSTQQEDKNESHPIPQYV